MKQNSEISKMYNEAAQKLQKEFTLDGVKYTEKSGRYYADNGYEAKRISKDEWDAAFQNRVFSEVNNGE